MSNDQNDEVSIDLDQVITNKVERPLGDTGEMGVRCDIPGNADNSPDSIDTSMTEQLIDLPNDPDIELDSRYVDPVIERVLTPYPELMNVLHVAHGDQITINDLVDGINQGKADSPESELFREMVRLKGAESAMQWLNATQQSINHMAYKNGLTDVVMRKDSRWLQGILIDDQVVGAFRPNVTNSKHKKGELLSGKDAMIRARQVMQIGDFITLPLPHTGIWVTLLVAGEDEMVNFHTRVLESKSVLGRRTAGLVFSNSDVIILRNLWDLMAGMIVSTSMGSANKKELGNLILIQDIPLMVAGYMAARFRTGYNIAQPCQVDPLKCNHVEVQKTSIGRMTIIDNGRLTEGQRAHIRKRNGHTPESVLAYQEHFAAMADNIAQLSPGVRVIFGMSSVENKLQAGEAWINAIEDSLTLAFKDTISREQRTQYINKQAAISALRQYAHFVRRIDYLDENGEIDGFVEGEELIYNSLKELSKDETIRDKFYAEVNRFITETTVGVVALPRYKCAACGHRQPMVNHHFPSFTPVNMERAFFTLLTNTVANSINSADI